MDVTVEREAETDPRSAPGGAAVAIEWADLQTSVHLSLRRSPVSRVFAIVPRGELRWYPLLAPDLVASAARVFEVEVLYRPLDCRVTVLWGERDDWIPIARGEALASLISAQPLTRISEAGHLVQEDAPEAIVAAMLARRF